LKDWLKNGWLVAHKPTKREIQDLLGVADRDLHDCQAAGLSADWRLNIAYNAALQLATASLAAAGFRAARESHHFRVIQALEHTIGAEQKLLDRYDLGSRSEGNDRIGETVALDGRSLDSDQSPQASMTIHRHVSGCSNCRTGRQPTTQSARTPCSLPPS
jgi:hypothetical protein